MVLAFLLGQRQQGNKKPLLYDRVLLVAILSIIVIGLIMVASSSVVISEKHYGTPFHFVLRQFIFFLIALVSTRYILKIPMRGLQKLSPYLFLASLILLIVVLVPYIGKSVNGSMRWIDLGFVSIQVSELAKLSTVLFLAGYLVRRNEEIRTRLIGFVKPMAIIALLVALLLKEPDFGTSVVIMVTAMTMMFLAGMRFRYFFILILCGVMAMSLIAIASPYRVKRITTFVNPWLHQYGSGYQLTQSLIAFGNGGVSGVGLGKSVQKLFYLPESHTDFLFAVLAEELGLIGIVVVFALYTLLIWRALFIGRRAQLQEEHFSAYVAYGIAIWLGFQFLINVGVNAGLLPTKGLTLPLMSYGGSSLLVDFVAVGLLFRIDFESRLKTYGLQGARPYRVKGDGL